MKRIKMLTLLAAAALVMTACNVNNKSSQASSSGSEAPQSSSSSAEPGPGPSPVDPDPFLAVRGPAAVAIGQEAEYFYVLENATGEVEWSVADSQIASINENGLLTGLSEGETTVKASLGELEATLDIIVADRSFYRTSDYGWSDEAIESMNDELETVLPFMRFGSDYKVEVTSGSDEYVIISDTYFYDLSKEYGALLEAAGFVEEAGYEGAYSKAVNEYGNTVYVFVEFDPDLGNSVTAYRQIKFHRTTSWPAQDVADYIGTAGHGAVLPECPIEADPDGDTYAAWYVVSGYFIFQTSANRDLTDEYGEDLSDAGLYYHYDEDNEQGIAFTWEQDLAVLSVGFYDEVEDEKVYNGFAIQLILDEPLELDDEYPEKKISDWFKAEYPEATDEFLPVPDSTGRGYNSLHVLTADDAFAEMVEDYVGKTYAEALGEFNAWYLAYMGYINSEYDTIDVMSLYGLLDAGVLEEPEAEFALMVYDPEGENFGAYHDALDTAGWELHYDSAEPNVLIAVSLNFEYMVAAILDGCIFQVSVYEFEMYDMDKVNASMQRFAPQGSSATLPRLPGYEYGSGSDYVYAAATFNDMLSFVSNLISNYGWGILYAESDYSEFYLLSPDEQIMLDVYYLSEHSVYEVDFYEATMFISCPDVRIAAILDMLAPGTTAELPTLESAEAFYSLEDNTPNKGNATFTVEGLTSDEVDAYVQALATSGGWDLEKDPTTGNVYGTSSDGAIEIELSAVQEEDESYTATLVIKKGVVFGDEWPTDAINEYLGDENGLPAFETSDSLQYAFYEADDGAHIYVDLEDEAVADAIDAYIATLSTAEFLLDADSGFYVSPDGSFYVEVSEGDLKGNSVLDIRVNFIQIFPYAEVNAWLASIGFTFDFSFLENCGPITCEYKTDPELTALYKEVKDADLYFIDLSSGDAEAIGALLEANGFTFMSYSNWEGYEYYYNTDCEIDVSVTANSDGSISIVVEIYYY